MTVFGILSIFLGTLLVFATSLETFGFPGRDDLFVGAAERSEIYRVWRTVGPVIDFVSSYVLLVSGIGLLLLKRWARIGLLGVSIVQIALCLVEIPLVILLMAEQGTEELARQGLTAQVWRSARPPG